MNDWLVSDCQSQNYQEVQYNKTTKFHSRYYLSWCVNQTDMNAIDFLYSKIELNWFYSNGVLISLIYFKLSFYYFLCVGIIANIKPTILFQLELLLHCLYHRHSLWVQHSYFNCFAFPNTLNVITLLCTFLRSCTI